MKFYSSNYDKYVEPQEAGYYIGYKTESGDEDYIYLGPNDLPDVTDEEALDILKKKLPQEWDDDFFCAYVTVHGYHKCEDKSPTKSYKCYCGGNIKKGQYEYECDACDYYYESTTEEEIIEELNDLPVLDPEECYFCVVDDFDRESIQVYISPIKFWDKEGVLPDVFFPHNEKFTEALKNSCIRECAICDSTWEVEDESLTKDEVIKLLVNNGFKQNKEFDEFMTSHC